MDTDHAVTEHPDSEADMFRLAHERKAARSAGLLRALGVVTEREPDDRPANDGQRYDTDTPPAS